MTVLNGCAGYDRVQRVGSFHELVNTPFASGVNGLYWSRPTRGDFSELVERLAVGAGITTLDESRLRRLSLSVEGRRAVDFALDDLRQLREYGLDPVLDCVNGYEEHEQSGPVRTDVCSFHVDSATVETDTWLCTYHGLPSEGLRNDDAIRRVDIPETRAALLKLFGGADDHAFLEYLTDSYFDLHYAPTANARPFSLGVGNLWRIAVAYPGSPVPPFIHRAPHPRPGQPPRLLLLS